MLLTSYNATYPATYPAKHTMSSAKKCRGWDRRDSHEENCLNCSQIGKEGTRRDCQAVCYRIRNHSIYKMVGLIPQLLCVCILYIYIMLYDVDVYCIATINPRYSSCEPTQPTMGHHLVRLKPFSSHSVRFTSKQYTVKSGGNQLQLNKMPSMGLYGFMTFSNAFK